MSEQIDEFENEEEELFEHHRIVADPGQEVIRIDKFLMDRLPNTSRNKIQNAAKNGTILVSGILSSDEKEITENFTQKGFKLIQIFTKENWLCIQFEK